MTRLSSRLLLRLWGTTAALIIILFAADCWVLRDDLRREACRGTEELARVYATILASQSSQAGLSPGRLLDTAPATLLARSKLGRDGYALLVDAEGRIRSRHGSTEGRRLDTLDRDLLRQITAKPAGHFEGREPFGGALAWIAHATVGDTGLRVVAFHPQKDLSRRIYSVNRVELWIALGGLAALLLLTALNAGAIARPVVRLSEAAARVATGDLHSEPPAIPGRDELAALADSFAKMVQGLRTQMVELERVTAERERFQSELRIARDIQRSILPRTFPPFPGEARFDVYAETLPAHEMGGDFYDFFLLSDQRLGLVIADVSDKGVPAALFMAVSRTLLRSVTLRGGAPGVCLSQVNSLLSADNDSSMFVTLFYGILDPATGELEYANAGHNPPLVLGSGAAPRRLDGKPGCPLGACDQMSYPLHHARIAPGELLFLYTDGITEAVDPRDQLFSEERLVSLLARSPRRSPREVITEVVAAVRAHAGERAQFDDITALALAYHGAESSRPC